MKLFNDFTKSSCNETAAASCDASVTLELENFMILYNDIDSCISSLKEAIESSNVTI